MKVNVDIISGFLGSGKTTLINRILDSEIKREKIAIIENEYGKVGIDGDLLKKENIEIKDITSGCICCSLTEDLDKALEDIYNRFKPDRIIVEPTGIGKLSDVIKAFEKTKVREHLKLNSKITVVNAAKFELLISGFGDFFQNQIENAETVLLSRVERISSQQLESTVSKVLELNPGARIIAKPMEQIDAEALLAGDKKEEGHMCEDGHHYHGCCCGEGSHDAHHGECNEAGHHHTHDGEDSHFGLKSWCIETDKVFDENTLKNALEGISQFGEIVRGKGIIRSDLEKWIKFDFVQGELSIKGASVNSRGKVSFIGRDLKTRELELMFS